MRRVGISVWLMVVASACAASESADPADTGAAAPDAADTAQPPEDTSASEAPDAPADVEAPADATTPDVAVPADRQTVSDGGSFGVSYVPDPDPLEVGVASLTLTVTAAVAPALPDDLAVSVSGWMPAHGHGFPVVPTVTALGDGRFQVENVRFSMPGDWEVRVALAAGGATETATFVLDL